METLPEQGGGDKLISVCFLWTRLILLCSPLHKIRKISLPFTEIPLLYSNMNEIRICPELSCFYFTIFFEEFRSCCIIRINKIMLCFFRFLRG